MKIASQVRLTSYFCTGVPLFMDRAVNDIYLIHQQIWSALPLRYIPNPATSRARVSLPPALSLTLFPAQSPHHLHSNLVPHSRPFPLCRILFPRFLRLDFLRLLPHQVVTSSRRLFQWPFHYLILLYFFLF